MGSPTLAHLLRVGVLLAAGVGCDRRVEPAAAPPSTGPDDPRAAERVASPTCQAAPHTPILDIGEGCGWAIMTAGIVTDTGQAGLDLDSGAPSIGTPGAGRMAARGQAKTSTPALVVMSLDLPPESVVSTVPVPSWCVGASHCEVQAAVVDGRRVLVRLSGGATHADTPSSREAFWLASTGPAFWFEPDREESWVDGGVSVGSVARFMPRRCGDQAWLRETTRNDAPPRWWRWSGARVSGADAASAPAADACEAFEFSAPVRLLPQNGI